MTHATEVLRWLLAEADGLTLALLHFLWQGTVVAALVAVAAAWVRRGPGRHAIYLGGLLVMLVCPPATFVVVTTANDVRDGDQSIPSLPAAVAESVPQPTIPQDRASAVLTADSTAPPPTRRLGAWVVPLWLAGVAALSLRLALGAWAVTRLRRAARPMPPEFTAMLVRLAERTGVNAHVLACARAAQPLAMGLLRPVVLVPAAMLADVPASLLEAAIAHELMHLRRRDLWVIVLQRVAETLLFFHPAVWWVSRGLSIERELCCDAAAATATGDRAAYAEALAWAAARPWPSSAWSAAMAGRESALIGRVRHVLRGPERPSLLGRGLSLAVVFAVIIAGAIGCARRGGAAASSPETPPAPGLVRAEYDLSDLYHDPIQGEPGDLIGSMAPVQPDPRESPEAVEARRWEQQADLLRLVRDTVGTPEDWRDPARITLRDGRPVIWATPQNHHEIARLLSQLRESRRYVLRYESRFVEANDAILADSDLSFSTGSPRWAYGDDIQSHTLARDASASHDGLRVLAVPTLLAVNGFEAYVSNARQKPYVSGVSRLAGRPEAKLAVAADGYVLTVWGTLDAGRKHATLRLGPHVAKLISIDSIATEQGVDGPVTIEAPRMIERRERVVVNVPLGETLVVDLGDAELPDWLYEGAAPRPKGNGKRQLLWLVKTTLEPGAAGTDRAAFPASKGSRNTTRPKIKVSG